MEYDDLTELHPDALPRPKCGRWYTAPFGQVAITPATVDDKLIAIVGGGNGSGGAIPDDVVSWDTFTDLDDDQQSELVASPLGIQPPEPFRTAVIEAAEAYTRVFDEVAAEYVYEEHRDRLPLPEEYDQHLPIDTDDRLRREDLSFTPPTTPLDDNIYFTRRGSITAFGDLNDNDYRRNIRLDPLNIRLIDPAEYRIVPFDVETPTGHAAADAIDGYWSQALSDHVASLVEDVDRWILLADEDRRAHL